MKTLVPTLAVMAALAAGAAAAQPAGFKIPAAEPIATPADLGAIPLRAAGAGAPEQWERMGHTRIVRNVVTPTLTPFLPDPAKATGAAVIVAPGGAFMMLSMDSEGYDVARWLADRGVAAFVLKYRIETTPRDPQAYADAVTARMAGVISGQRRGAPAAPAAPAAAIEDGRAAVRLLRARASEWRIDPHRVGFVGFSAGAMTALTVALSPDAADRPDFVAPIYGPMGPVTVPADAPPMFTALAADDPLFGTGGFDLVTSWKAARRPVEFHLYEHGGHGFGMQKTGTSSEMWIDEFYKWMDARGLLKRAG